MLFFTNLSDMKFTFGIVTKGNTSMINKAIESIRSQNIPNYEIIVVGGPNEFVGTDIKWVPIDDSEITFCQKKNCITDNSTGDVLTIMHDYIGLRNDWYNGFVQFGFDWDICMTRVLDIYERRFYDWITWDHPTLPRYYPLPYNDNESCKYTFIPGGYWVAKKHVMVQQPLNNLLQWGQSEDIEWTMRVRHFKYVMNPFSSVIHLKKHRGFDEEKALSEKY